VHLFYFILHMCRRLFRTMFLPMVIAYSGTARIPRHRHRHPHRLARHAYILARILAMMSVSMSVSWNAGLTTLAKCIILQAYKIDQEHFVAVVAGLCAEICRRNFSAGFVAEWGGGGYFSWSMSMVFYCRCRHG